MELVLQRARYLLLKLGVQICHRLHSLSNADAMTKWLRVNNLMGSQTYSCGDGLGRTQENSKVPLLKFKEMEMEAKMYM